MAKDAKKIILNVPAHEVEIIEWLNNQSNMNQSIRKLIRDCIQVYGTCDLNELPIIVEHLRAKRHDTPKRRPGRPRKVDIHPPTTEAYKEPKKQFIEQQTFRTKTQTTSQQDETVFQEQLAELTEELQVATKTPDVQYGTEINTDFSGSFAHNEVTNNNQPTQAQSDNNNSSSGVANSLKNNLMDMFNGK